MSIQPYEARSFRFIELLIVWLFCETPQCLCVIQASRRIKSRKSERLAGNR